jgi:hypothetical protein
LVANVVSWGSCDETDKGKGELFEHNVYDINYYKIS